MKKIIAGLWGSAVGGSFTIDKLKYYENLRQALVELSKDKRYEVHYWDFRQYNSVVAERAKRDGQFYTPEIKRSFQSNDEIASPGIIISLEYDLKNKKNEIYVRSFNTNDYLIETRTPEEIRGGIYNGRQFFSTSGSWSSDSEVYYLVGWEHLKNRSNDVFGYYKEINSIFDLMK